MANSKIRAWDYIHEDCKAITQFGWTSNPPLEVQHLQDAWRRMEDANLTIDQIYAMGELVYWAHKIGAKKLD
jgi:hypothetical protein